MGVKTEVRRCVPVVRPYSRFAWLSCTDGIKIKGGVDGNVRLEARRVVKRACSHMVRTRGHWPRRHYCLTFPRIAFIRPYFDG
jgi:hypothetical protein